MSAILRDYQGILLGALAAVFVFFGGRWVLRQTIRRMWDNFLAGQPRLQSNVFVHRMRDLVFKDPFTYMNLLWSDGRDALVRQVWQGVGRQAMRTKLPGDLRPATELAPEGMSVSRLHLRDGRAIAVITTPPPQKKGEPIFIGVVLPSDPGLKDDLLRARRCVHYFILNHGGAGDSSRDTDLCGWTHDGKFLTYNVGAPRNVEGFARAVDDKLQELERLRDRARKKTHGRAVGFR